MNVQDFGGADDFFVELLQGSTCNQIGGGEGSRTIPGFLL